MSLWKRIGAFFRRRELDREFDEEARAHLDLATEDLIQLGHSPDEARRLARMKFGAVAASKDAHRDSRGLPGLESLLYDLRHTVRGLRRDWQFSGTVIVILALALGMNLTAFRVLDSNLFRGFPGIGDNRRLMFIDEQFPTPGCCVSYMDYEVWKQQAHSFEDMAFAVDKQVSLGATAASARDEWLPMQTYEGFHVLGVRPLLGRDFTSADQAPGAAPVIILNHRFWTTRLGQRADVIGSQVYVDGTATTVIGVMPEGFDSIGRTEAWLPLEDNAALHTTVANGGWVLGRLRDGASEAAARREIEAINARLAIERPATNRGVRAFVVNFIESIAGPRGQMVYGSLWAGAWLVLAIACANLANLALARAQGRTREMCTRMALGAGRVRVIRQLLLESLLLTGIAGVLAWALAAETTQLWAAATTLPRQIRDYSPSAATVAYLTAVVLFAAGLITLAPISRLWRLARHGDVQEVLRGEGRSATMSRQGKRFSAALVAGQMALAVILMASAGVLGRSLEKVLGADLGITAPETVLVGHVSLPSRQYPTPASRAAYFHSVQERLAATPGVLSAAWASGRPTDDFEPRQVELESQLGSMQGAPTFPVSPNYVHTIGASILAGRDFSEADRPNAAAVAIVNQRFAEAHFPGQNPLGQRIRLYVKRQPGPGEWRTIVGVVSNIMQNDASRQQFLPAIYLPFAQQPTNFGWFFARTRSVSPGIAAAVRYAVRQVDPNLEDVTFNTLDADLGFHLMSEGIDTSNLSKHAAVATVFAGVALLLAALGLLAVVARSVGQRTREIGIRMALGATSRAIQSAVLWEAMTPVVVGLVVGLIASLGVNRVLQSQLVGVSPYDLPTLTVAPLVLIAVALFGSLLPVRQVSRVDPAVTLRHE